MLTNEMFREKLASVKDAVSVKGGHYTDIKLEDTVITFQRSKNKRECIAISELYDIYLNEATINTTIIKKYLSQRTHSPAYAILRAAGLYDNKNERIESKSKVENTVNYASSTFLKSKTRQLLFLIHAIPIIAVLSAIFFLSSEPYPFTFANLMIGLIIFIVSASFFFYVFKLKKDNIGEITYTSYFTLLIFIIGIFPFYNYVKDYQSRNRVRVAYTAGFRAWGSMVKIYDIKISYYDRFGNPKNLNKIEINNPENWITGLWLDDNQRNNLQLKDSSSIKITNDTLFLTLVNSGAILKPKVFGDRVTSFYVNAKVKFLQADPKYDSLMPLEKYSSVQFCLKVPVDVRNMDTNEIYYGHEFFFHNFSWSKLRIPGFNFDFDQEQLHFRLKNNENDENAKQIVYGINETIFKNSSFDSIAPMKLGSVIHLSALKFDDNASFNIYKEESSHSLPLFKFNISEYGAFVLKDR